MTEEVKLPTLSEGLSDKAKLMFREESLLEALRTIAELQEKKRIMCIYCGWKTDPIIPDNNQWAPMQEHIRTCDKRMSPAGLEAMKGLIESKRQIEHKLKQAQDAILLFCQLPLSVVERHFVGRCSPLDLPAVVEVLGRKEGE